MNRRSFAKHVLVALASCFGALHLLRAARLGAPAYVSPQWQAFGLVRPPGSQAEPAFLASCIRCQRCFDACEAGAIRLFGAGAGVLEGTPFLVPETVGCTLCLRCGAACPTGAIAVLTDKRRADMGDAVVDKDLCVSWNGTGICGACFTVCPLRGKAISQGAHNQPTVHPEACVGCGLCEAACIVKRDKAIRVHASRSWPS